MTRGMRTPPSSARPRAWGGGGGGAQTALTRDWTALADDGGHAHTTFGKYIHIFECHSVYSCPIV